ncbi:UNVERIFIED_CONTAM: hypothetical protein FKN15_054316 [Acipenser sinensis]
MIDRCNTQNYIWHKGARCESVITEFQVMCITIGAAAVMVLLLFMITVFFTKKLHLLKTENCKLRKRSCNTQDYIWHKGARCESVITEFQVMCITIGAAAVMVLLLFMITVFFTKKLHLLKTENCKLRKRSLVPRGRDRDPVRRDPDGLPGATETQAGDREQAVTGRSGSLGTGAATSGTSRGTNWKEGGAHATSDAHSVTSQVPGGAELGTVHPVVPGSAATWAYGRVEGGPCIPAGCPRARGKGPYPSAPDCFAGVEVGAVVEVCFSPPPLCAPEAAASPLWTPEAAAPPLWAPAPPLWAPEAAAPPLWALAAAAPPPQALRTATPPPISGATGPAL